jgi:hypothetical protein
MSDGYVTLDGDSDNDELRHPVPAEADELPLLREFATRASPADAHAITALVKRYYAASTAGNAAGACSMLLTSLASGLAAHDGASAGGAHDTCTASMSRLLAQQHRRLVSEDVSTMKVLAVRVKDALGLAVLGFKRTPESEIVLQRGARGWKIAVLFSSYMP